MGTGSVAAETFKLFLPLATFIVIIWRETVKNNKEREKYVDTELFGNRRVAECVDPEVALATVPEPPIDAGQIV